MRLHFPNILCLVLCAAYVRISLKREIEKRFAEKKLMQELLAKVTLTSSNVEFLQLQ